MTEHFYILTIRWTRRRRDHIGTIAGIVNVGEAETEHEIHRKLYEQARARFGAPLGRSSTLYYYLVVN